MSSGRLQYALGGVLMLYLAAACVSAAPGAGILRGLGLVAAGGVFLPLAYDALWLAFVGEREPRRPWWA